MLKHALTGTGLAIGVTLLGASQVLARDFFIDTFNNQFTGPCQIVSGTPPAGTCTTNQTTGTNTPSATNPFLQTGANFSTSATNPAFIRDPSGLPPNQVIGESRNLELFSVLNANNLAASGSSRVNTTSPGSWQIASSGGSRISTSMIWNNINPDASPTVSNSGKFVDRLRRGALAFQTIQVVPGINSPANIFTFVLRDSNDRESRVSRSAITSNQFVFITFEEFRAASNFLIDLNAIKYVELNVVTGGGGSSTVRVDFVRGFEIPEPSLVLGLGIVFCVGYLSTKGSRARMLKNEDSL